jgi:hypothetical protein
MAGTWARLLGTLLSSFGIGTKGTRATLDASGLTSNRTLTLPDASGTLALKPFSYASGAGASVSNTTVLTQVVSFTLTGGTLGDGSTGALRVRVSGRYRNNNAGATAATFRIQFSYGGQVLWEGVSAALTANAGIHACGFDVILQGAGATNQQNFGGRVGMSIATAPTTGVGGITNVPTSTTGITGDINNGAPNTVDSTANQTFSMSVQHSVADAATIFVLDGIAAVFQ